MPFKMVFSKKYTVKLRAHVFRADKFAAALKLLLKSNIIKPEDIAEPPRPSRRDLELAHTRRWTDKLLKSRLTAEDEALAEIKASKEVVEAHIMNVGGTVLAARLALETGLGINCGGGAHHAFADHGEGFCLLNDIAVAVRKMQKEKKIKKALIIDLDAHQGNGTAAIFKKDKRVFTFSMHQEALYPEVKEKSSLDVELRRGTGDRRYLKALKEHLPGVFKRSAPDLVVYNAGVDVYRGDRLGGLKLTAAGVRKRDEMVFAECFKRNIPAVLVLSGGYAAGSGDTARLHANTMKAAIRLLGK
ncbi:MAG: histone deacetylase [Elusimicrobia bacterium]|nr:histone deacetylase [Elusimicrobiota bacterium]